jgi:haloacetate dehalogenase
MFEGFTRYDIETAEARIATFVGGNGPPLLLLHGYPQTHVAWHRVAPALTKQYTVVASDLRGYGDSVGPQGAADPAAYSKRTMARDQLTVMRHLGFDRFGVVGHDRGARVGYRLALDHEDAVTAFVSLTVIPTSEVWARVNMKSALGAYHWLLFAQPFDLPERLLAGDPDYFLEWTLRKMTRHRERLSDEAVLAYREAFRRPAVRHAMMQDYRAGAGTDNEQDLADRAAGRKLRCPVLVLWEQGRFPPGDTPLEIWRNWATAVEGREIPGGHLQAEEAPEAVLEALLPFLSRHMSM